MFLLGNFEKSLVLYHKAKSLRKGIEFVQEAIDSIGQTIISSLENCFDAFEDTDDIIKVC